MQMQLQLLVRMHDAYHPGTQVSLISWARNPKPKTPNVTKGIIITIMTSPLKNNKHTVVCDLHLNFHHGWQMMEKNMHRSTAWKRRKQNEHAYKYKNQLETEPKRQLRRQMPRKKKREKKQIWDYNLTRSAVMSTYHAMAFIKYPRVGWVETLEAAISMRRLWRIHTQKRSENQTRQNKTKQDKIRQDKTRQDKARQDKTRQDKTRRDETRQEKTRQDKTRQDQTRQDKTRQDKTKQDKKTRQDNATQRKTTQHNNTRWHTKTTQDKDRLLITRFCASPPLSWLTGPLKGDDEGVLRLEWERGDDAVDRFFGGTRG